MLKSKVATNFYLTNWTPKDNSGSISLEEFHLAMCKFSYISKKSAEEIMKDIDEDKNKTLSLEGYL